MLCCAVPMLCCASHSRVCGHIEPADATALATGELGAMLCYELRSWRRTASSWRMRASARSARGVGLDAGGLLLVGAGLFLVGAGVGLVGAGVGLVGAGVGQHPFQPFHVCFHFGLVSAGPLSGKKWQYAARSPAHTTPNRPAPTAGPDAELHCAPATHPRPARQSEFPRSGRLPAGRRPAGCRDAPRFRQSASIRGCAGGRSLSACR